MKNKNRIFLYAMAFAVILLLTHGCMYSDIEEVTNVDNMEYLSSTDIKTLDEVCMRLEPYVKIEQGKLKLLINTSDEVRISEQLLQTFKRSIVETNDKIDTGELILIDGGISVPGIDLPIKRIKTRSEGDKSYTTETNSYWWGMTSKTTYDQQGAYDYVNDYSTSRSVTGIIAGILVGGMDSKAGAAFTVMYGAGAITTGNAMYEAAKKGSLTVETTLRTYASPPNNVSISVFDKDRNLIAVFTPMT